MPSYAVYWMNAFLLSLVLTHVLKNLAVRLGLVDVPGGRKDHEGSVPLAGGLAMFLAFVTATTLLNDIPPAFLGLAAGLLILVLCGTLDDLFDIPAKTKLAIQCIAALVVVLPGGAVIENLGHLFGGAPVSLSGFAVPFTLLFVVGLTNAMNMVDGLDGLAGGLTVIALLWSAVAAAVLGLQDYLVLSMLLAFVVLGFLVFNIRHPWQLRAAVFMGNGGSMMLGSVLAFLAIGLSQGPGVQLSPVAAAWIIALPAIDTVSLAVRRIIAGRNPLHSDRQHIHHLLLRAGFSVNETVVTLLTVSAILGGLGIGAWSLGVPDSVMLSGLVAVVALHTYFVCHGWKRIDASRFWRVPGLFGLGRPAREAATDNGAGPGASHMQARQSLRATAAPDPAAASLALGVGGFGPTPDGWKVGPPQPTAAADG